MKISRSLVITFLTTALLGGALVAHAQSATCSSASFCPLQSVDGTKLSDIYGSSDLTSFINSLFTFSLSMGAILAVLRLGWAGYLYMTTDSWGSKGHAREVIGDVVIGLMLLLGIYLILFQINPDILKLNILDSLKQEQTATN